MQQEEAQEAAPVGVASAPERRNTWQGQMRREQEKRGRADEFDELNKETTTGGGKMSAEGETRCAAEQK